MRRSDTLRTLRPRFATASLGRTIPRACLRSTQARRRPGARDLRVWLSLHANCYRDGAAGSPRFPGNPRGPMPCSPTPARPDAPRRWRCADVAPVVSTTKAPAGTTLEAQSHGLGPGCLRFVIALTVPPTQDSLPVAG